MAHSAYSPGCGAYFMLICVSVLLCTTMSMPGKLSQTTLTRGDASPSKTRRARKRLYSVHSMPDPNPHRYRVFPFAYYDHPARSRTFWMPSTPFRICSARMAQRSPLIRGRRVSMKSKASLWFRFSIWSRPSCVAWTPQNSTCSVKSPCRANGYCGSA